MKKIALIFTLTLGLCKAAGSSQISNPTINAVISQPSTEITTNTVWTGQRIIPQGNLVTVDTGVTLTINGFVSAGPYQIFNLVGTGTVIFPMNAPGVNTGYTVNQSVYPEWWGAAGDGTTDSAAAINAAIASFQQGWGRVLFTGKQYRVDSRLIINGVSYISLDGIIAPWRPNPLPQIISSSTVADVLYIAPISDGVTIQNLAFTRSSGGTTGSKTIDVGAIVHPTFENDSWSGSQYGLYVSSGASGPVIKNCNASPGTDGNGSVYGIFIDGRAGDVTGVDVDNYGWLGNATSDVSYAYADIQTGGSAKGLGDRRLFGIHGSGAVNYPIFLQDGGGFSSDLLITNVSFDTILSTGITLKSTSNSFAQQAVISNGWLNLSTSSAVGVYLQDRDMTTISGITLASYDGTNKGIVESSGLYGSIQNCNFTGNAAFNPAVSLTSSSSNTISGCTGIVGTPLTIASGSNNNSVFNNLFSSTTNAGSANTIVLQNTADGFAKFDANGTTGIYLSRNGTNVTQWVRDANDTYFDYSGTIGRLFFRSGIGGPTTLTLDSSGDLLAAGTLTVGSGTNQITTAAGLLDATKLTNTIPNSSIDSSSVTKQGNTFNGNSQLIQTTSSGALSLSSGTVTNLNTSTLKFSDATTQVTAASSTTLVQTVFCTNSVSSATTAGSFVPSNISCSITPKSSSDRVVIASTFFTSLTDISINAQGVYTFYRASTNLGGSFGLAALVNGVANTAYQNTITLTYVDSPATTSSTSYSVRMFAGGGATVTISDSNIPSTMILQEVR